ncbi:hypothetical protein [Vibrio parahaemolyticus]|uniref:hypothetical protein n=1 Tax=Vibrio parahaemolyticus TaxID=670 RepID=UPI00111D0458|nr:hypothetical protein [Vibrio parahaemolyticus]TOE34592.1 hypothetical protein CGJ46_05250 [Vibrio parahaemolyticus]
MPIAFEYPIPKHWQDFERMLKDLHPDMNLFGSPGQNQEGIDLFSINGKTVMQAKKKSFNSKKLTIADIKSWVFRAKDFFQSIQFEHLILATTLKRDVKLQKELIDFVKEHKEQLDFDVELLFWDDIEEKFIENPWATRKYYLTELYDPQTIERLNSTPLTAYFESTLIHKILKSSGINLCTDLLPEVEGLTKELRFRLNPGFGHNLNAATLFDDLQPLVSLCKKILCGPVAEYQASVNIPFEQKSFLPIEWSSKYLSNIRETDIVPVLEVDSAFINWINSTRNLLEYMNNHPNFINFSGFDSKVKHYNQTYKELINMISVNVEALAAYLCLQDNLSKRGICLIDNDCHHVKNIRNFGYYGYVIDGENRDINHSLKIIPIPLQNLKTWLYLEEAKGIVGKKIYFKPLPQYSSTRVMHLS